jgi:hypothetical protein
MKGAPDWKVNTDSVNGSWKINLLEWLGKVTGIRTLVETGTCHGSTPFHLAGHFALIHTIELHDELFEISQRRLAKFKHIHCWHGSSRTMLPAIFQYVPDGPVLFWLDAHNSGPHTADDGDPLTDELAVITAAFPDALIVIDDMPDETLYNVPERNAVLEGWHREYRTGEVIIYKEGRYNIPPFEL